MAPWRWRLALRRVRVQAPLIAMVLLVSVVAAASLSTLYLLDHATSTFAARAALHDASSADLTLTHTVAAVGPVADIVDASDRAAEQGLGGTPVSTTVHVEGALYVIPSGERYVLGYLASGDDLPSIAALLDGEWPQHRGVGAPEVLVPQRMEDDLGIGPGDILALKERSYAEDGIEVRVVGTYLPIAPDGASWRPDLLSGSGYSPSVSVPGAGGGLTAPAYGPLLTTLEDVEAGDVSNVVVTYTPDFSDITLGDLRSISTNLGEASTNLQRQEGDLARRVTVSDPVSATVGRVIGSLTMTRSAVFVTALLLLVVTAAALVQVARLVAERRHSERLLMAARGASTRQTFHLAALEVVGIGAATVAGGGAAARGAYLLLAKLPLLADAGLARDPGYPAGVWITSAVVATVLAAVVLAPLVRRSPSLVEAESDRARPGRRASFQRAGLDVAAFVLAGIAFWQLSLYKSPVVTGEQAPRLDPVLAAGPALALLAGALLTARVVPLAARAMEALATSARRAVTPLAAWEVARRPVRALSAVLLLTLSLSVGTFSAGFLATWSQSQRDQALFLHPVDAVATAPDAGWMSGETLVSAPDAAVSPVVQTSVAISSQTFTDLSMGRERFAGEGARLVASSQHGWEAFGVGRLAERHGDRLSQALHAPTDPAADGIALPDGSTHVTATLTASPTVEELTDVLVDVRMLVVSASGEYATIDLGIAPANGKPQSLGAALGDTAIGAHIVGFQAVLVSTGDAELDQQTQNMDRVRVNVGLSDLAAATAVQGWSLSGIDAPLVPHPLDASPGNAWSGLATVGLMDDVKAHESSIDLTMSVPMRTLLQSATVGVVTASKPVGPVPVVVTDAALRSARLEVGNDATLQLGATYVRARVAAALWQVPGIPGDVVAADAQTLALATFQSGGIAPRVTEWWITTPDQASYAAAVPPSVTVTTRDGVVASLTTDPLRVAITASIWVVVGAAAALAALGFAVHVVVSTRSRSLEFAQLRAVGLSRGATVRVLGVETTLLAALGTVFGLALGWALVTLAAPLVSFGPDGRPPVPDVVLRIPVWIAGAVALEAAGVVVVSLAIAAGIIRRIRPADLLRQGDAR